MPHASNNMNNRLHVHPEFRRKLQRHLLRQTIVAALIGLLALPAAALPEDAKQEIVLEADEWEGTLNGTSRLEGDVRLVQGTLRVNGDVMVVERTADAVIRVTAEGQTAHYEQQLNSDQALVTADAELIVYHVAEQRIELRGTAKLSQQDNQFHGEVIFYDMANGTIDAAGSDAQDTSAEPSGRVKLIWQPSSPAPSDADGPSSPDTP